MHEYLTADEVASMEAAMQLAIAHINQKEGRKTKFDRDRIKRWRELIKKLNGHFSSMEATYINASDDDDEYNARADFGTVPMMALIDHVFARYENNNMTSFERFAAAGVNAMSMLVHKTACDAGWYRNPRTGKPKKRNFGEVVALMHSELSEALEADRKSLKDNHLPHLNGVDVEFSDCVIRIMDTAMARGIDLGTTMIEKNRVNVKRADHKLSNRKKRGGKKY